MFDRKVPAAALSIPTCTYCAKPLPCEPAYGDDYWTTRFPVAVRRYVAGVMYHSEPPLLWPGG